jgi:hypothetical protein
MDARIVEIAKSLGLKCRTKDSFSTEPCEWGFLIMPVASYFEGHGGPVSEKDLEWIDIDPVVLTYRGKLVPDLKEDKKVYLLKALEDRNIQYEDKGEFIRVR